MIRVVIAEDSATCRDLLVQLMESDPDFRVAGTAHDGREAVEMCKRLRPDVVVMDIHMPVMNGFEATRQIMIEAPTPIVIVSATIDVKQAEVSLQALRMGALTVLPKPMLADAAQFEELANQFVSSVRAMSAVRVVRRWSDRPRSDAPAQPRSDSAVPRIVAIGASTGGPAALYRVLSELPADLPLPILVVQHIAHGFVRALATWLDAASPLNVRVAEQGESVKAGNVYLAVDDHHLGVTERGVIETAHTPALAGFRPSATHLFRSVANSYGSSSIAVILTGMGEDGVDGLRMVHAAGGYVIAQDRDSSVVFGMPGAAVAAGVVDSIVPLDMVALRLKRLVVPVRSPEVQEP